MAIDFEAARNYQPSPLITKRLNDHYFAGVVGPAGVGKDTIMDEITEYGDSFTFSKVVSGTSRPPRAGEVYGEDYYFIDASRKEAELAELEAKFIGRQLLQIAAHPTIEQQYYWSEIKEWTKSEAPMMDVLTDEYDKLHDYPFKGSLAFMITAEPEDYFNRFKLREDDISKSEALKRLYEARKSLLWGLDKRHDVAWVHNNNGEIDRAASQIAKTVLSQLNRIDIAGERYQPEIPDELADWSQAERQVHYINHMISEYSRYLEN